MGFERRFAVRRRSFAVGARAWHFRVGAPVTALLGGLESLFERALMLREKGMRHGERALKEIKREGGGY